MNDHPTQECLIDYLHRELPPGEDATVLMHLEACADCRTRYDAEAAITEILRDYARATERELPGAVRAAIWNRIDAQRPSLADRLRRLLRPAAGFAVATAAAVAIAAGLGTFSHPGSTTIDAAYYLDDHAALTGTVPFHEGSAVPSSLLHGRPSGGQQWLASSGSSDVAVDGVTH